MTRLVVRLDRLEAAAARSHRPASGVIAVPTGVDPDRFLRLALSSGDMPEEGCVVVPAVMSPADWEAAAMAQQAQLMRECQGL